MSETRMLNGKDHISLLAKCNIDTYVTRTAKHILERHEKANNALVKMGISARYELYHNLARRPLPKAQRWWGMNCDIFLIFFNLI